MAAAGLHLLALHCWPAWQLPSNTPEQGRVLQAELLKQRSKVVAPPAQPVRKAVAAAPKTLPAAARKRVPKVTKAPARPAAKQAEVAVVKRQPVKQAVMQAAKPAESTSLQAEQRRSPVSQPAEERGRELAAKQTGSARIQDDAKSDSKPEVAYLAADHHRVESMPAKVRQMIQARISYPRKARRKGWQGKAVFHLDVHGQKLTRVALLQSSGHDLLDNSAMRGIRSVESLPLASGRYSLPVEFRLQ